MTTETDTRKRFPLPAWALALMLLGAGGGAGIGGAAGAYGHDARIRALEVESTNLEKRLERIDRKLDQVLESLRGR